MVSKLRSEEDSVKRISLGRHTTNRGQEGRGGWDSRMRAGINRQLRQRHVITKDHKHMIHIWNGKRGVAEVLDWFLGRFLPACETCVSSRGRGEESGNR